MTKELPRKDHRLVTRRIIVRGELVLESPTCLGSGEADSPTDMPLLVDSISKCALLTGTSIAGALRNHLLHKENGYESQEQRNTLAALLFGDWSLYDDEKKLPEGDKQRLQDVGHQSPLIINDSVSDSVSGIELRDSVKIDSRRGTAVNKAKFDFELLSTNTKFPLYFELLIEDEANENWLKKALAITLQGLEQGEISLGMKKWRGFGRCKSTGWQVWNFDLTNPQKCREWLKFDHWTPGFLENYSKTESIANALGVDLSKVDDKRDRLTLKATFSLDGSLLIRSGQASTDKAPDVVHLKSNGKPIVSGTSLAGVLRHRAERIVKTLQGTPSNGEPNLVKTLFGDVDEKSKTAQSSRLIVHEAKINESHDMVQNRIAIDRFTGGAYHGALFNEQPVWGDENTKLTIELELHKPKSYEIGLLLLLLKDLWTGDLPVGGESSIGRGRLKGKEATVTHYQPGPQNKSWKITQGDQHLEVENPDELESFVKALVDEVSEEEAA